MPAEPNILNDECPPNRLILNNGSSCAGQLAWLRSTQFRYSGETEPVT